MNRQAIHITIANHALSRPHAVAVTCGNQQLSYGELNSRADRLAKALRGHGVGVGDIVAVNMDRGTDLIVGLLGILKSGAAYLPIDPAYPLERQSFMVTDAQAVAWLGNRSQAQAPEGLTCPLLWLDELMATNGPDGLDAAVDQTQAAQLDDLAYVIYTSGSTGKPKGCMVTHGNVARLFATTQPDFGFNEHDAWSFFHSVAFDFSVWEIWGGLVHGGRVVVVPYDVSRAPEAFLQLLIDEQVTVLSQTPAAFRGLIAADVKLAPEASSLALKWVFLGGEALDLNMLKPWFARHGDLLPRLVNGYGPTETTVFATFKQVSKTDTQETQGSDIGMPLADLSSWVLDEALRPCPEGEMGELFIGGPGVSRGYLNRLELTAERFITWTAPDAALAAPLRLYRTGDLVRRLPNGHIGYQGRIDTQVKIRGFRIEIGEIESQLGLHPGVQAAAVVAWPSPEGSDARLVAYVVPSTDLGAEAANASSLRTHLMKSVPEFMVPGTYVSLSALPLTANGKVDRRALPAPGRQRPDLATPYSAPATPLEASLCAAFARVLDIDQVGAHDHFFELGGSSLKVLRLIADFNDGRDANGLPKLRVADVYDRMSPAGLAALLSGQTQRKNKRARRSQEDQDIAIVGMALRTPGADGLEAFWQNLLEGQEGIRRFEPHELDPSIPDAIRLSPHFVPARAVMSQPGRFDAAFFGVPPREATITDPQQRHLLELSWAALEHAGIDPTLPDSLIGVFAGTAQNTYLTALRDAQPELIEQYGEFQTMLASEKDYPAIRVAYRLNLHGPAISVHSACSTGLVAVAQAVQALRSGQCDVALGGGATLAVPQEGGYLHVEGAMESADGRCRPFDAAASGTVFGNGAAVVVLKRLADALADGDTVYAVIKGVGVNNDGGDKASFTAPSVSGQAQVVRMALDDAGVSARRIGYVEAHGTGTPLGDPIEVAALTRAWSADTSDSGFCTLGSVKGNLGHLVAAAGVVGLIKAAMALHRERIPGTLHFEQPNAQLGLAQTPFMVQAQTSAWPRQSGEPRLAAVSSFGVGGTNAHVILQEGPAGDAHRVTPSSCQDATWLLPLSARSAPALQQRAIDLADWLERHPATALSEVAATLMKGRSAMPWRQAVVASSPSEAAASLRTLAQGAPLAADRRAQPLRVVFLFPGQGSQHPGMAAGLYEAEPAFREALDRCFDALASMSDAPWRHWLLEAAPDDEAAAQSLSQTRHAQLALFCVSHALAAWLDSLGITADARVGHSIGEWAAACHAGVFRLPDALRAVMARGEAMQAQPPGAMLAVRADASTTKAMLPTGIDIAGLNAPTLTVVAGPHELIEQLQTTLDANNIAWTRLKVSHAFHSASMDGALPRFEAALHGLSAQAPQGVVYSSLTGEPLSAEQATSPAYWARQIRGAVRFSQAVEQVLSQGPTLFIEVGPGQALSALVRQNREQRARGASPVAPRVVPLLGPAAAPGKPLVQALQALGQIWSAGVSVAWPLARQVRRAVLPTYPFQGQTHWFVRSTEPQSKAAAPALDALPQSQLPPSDLPAFMKAQNMSRQPLLKEELKRILSEVSGVPTDELLDDGTLMDQGLDSLSLTQATLELDRAFGIKLRFRRLMEDLDTISALAAFLDAELPADRFAPAPAPAAMPVAAPVAAPPMAARAFSTQPLAGMPALPAQGVPDNIVSWQIQLIEQQLQLLKAMLPGSVPPQMALALPAPIAAPIAASVPASPAQPASATEPSDTAPSGRALLDKPFGASARITLKPQEDMNAHQQAWLLNFIDRYNAKSGQSKAYAQRYRDVMADPRVVTGFNPLWKDLVYPIVVNRSKGNRMWDLDQNEYIDLLSCFGANLLGYQPEDITQALIDQVKAGFEVGPQHELAGEVAVLMSEVTGHERVAFCNTGSEAVMGAMRMARTVTGRKTIAIFSNSYHGIFDEVIVRGTRQLRSLSAAPGILASAVENVLVLDYGSDEALKVIKERGHELAAVLIEPIQSRNLDLRPHAFVRELRALCDASGAALIFDEVITGFRIAMGGAQAYYGVRADIATYGKVVGGGIPFAVIAGSRLWMDALDGGTWQFGDDSYPEAGVTYFAGTFVRHPLALAAAKASLLHLKKSGPALQETLNARTTALADRLNEALVARGAPAKAVHFSSVWRLVWDEDQRFVSLFYYLLRYHGLHVYEQFGHFMTEAFTEADFDRLFHTCINALDELMALGLIRPRSGPTGPGGSGPGGPGGLPLPSSQVQTGDTAPLTPGQTERWLASRFDPAARRAINETLCLHLDGQINTETLRSAVAEVAMRHPAFRIAFDADEPVQIVQTPATDLVTVLDLASQFPPTMVDAALAAFYDQTSATDFPVEQAPMARLTVVRLGANRHIVHLVTSHLVFDGWGSSVFVHELSEVLSAHQQGKASNLPKPESPLAFSRAEQARMEGPDGQADLAWWREVLREPPAPLLLSDRKPPTSRLYTADTVRATIPPALLTALKATARQHKATLFQTLLAALGLSLRQASGQADMVVSIPYASQSLGSHPALIADGVLDLPLRLHIEASVTGSQWLNQVRSTLMDASEHPLMTQGTVAWGLGLPRRGDRPPLTGVFFNLNPRVDLSELARLPHPLQATISEAPKRGLLNELFFNFYDLGDHLSLDLHFSTELFTPLKAQALVDGLMGCCEWLAQTPAATVPGIKPPPAAIDPRLLAWNDTNQVWPSVGRVEALLAQQAARTPDAPAVLAQGVQLSHGDIERRANQIAHLLQARGAGPGQFIGLCLGRGPWLLPSLLGVLKTGAAYVPLDPGFPIARLQHMAQDAQLTMLVTESSHAGLLAIPRAHQLRVDDDLALIEHAPGTPIVHAQALSSDDPAYAIYTSGSTGKPKGVVVPHRAVVNFLMSMRREPGLHAGDYLLAVTTLSFDIAVLELLLPLAVGARAVLVSRDDAADGQALRHWCDTEGITVMQATPSTWHALLDAGWQPAPGFKALVGGEPLPPRLAQALLAAGVELWNMYGPTETTVWSSTARIANANQAITIGRPIANTSIWVLDEHGDPAPIGTPGELCIGGHGVALGYHRLPEMSSERFTTDAFSSTPGARLYRTGDLAKWRDDGQIEHLGRLDHQVKIRGYRIELGEIEHQLTNQPGVARCVVVARQEPGGDDDVHQLVAYLVAKPGAVLDAASLREQIRVNLPDYMVPQHHIVLDALPLLPNGKIDRHALPEPSQVASSAGSKQAPQTALECQIAQDMAELLGVPDLGRDEHFFELGGHSLMAARLSARLVKATGQRLGLKVLFEHPTVASLAAYIQSQQAPEQARIEARPQTQQDAAPMSLMQQRLWFIDNLQPGGVADNLPSGHRLRGPMNVAALEQTLQHMVNQQASLRTRVRRNERDAEQEVLASVPLRLQPVVDFSDLSSDVAEDRAFAAMDLLVRTPFQLEAGPLFVARLYKLAEQDHVLFFMTHHLIWDGWSFDLMYEAIARDYPLRCAGQPLATSPLPLSYGDFAAWQQDWLQGAELQRQLAPWLAKFSPPPAALELPTERQRPILLTPEGGSVQIDIPRSQLDRLHQLAREKGTTLYTVLLSAFSVFIARLSQRDDFVIGTPVRGRDVPELEPIMGFFVNVLPLRMKVDAALRFDHYIDEVKREVSQALSFPDVPMEHLVRELKLPRDLSRPPLVQVMFSFQDVRDRQNHWGELQHSRFDLDIHGSAQDIGLWCVETTQLLEAVFIYNQHVFSADAVSTLSRRFAYFLYQLGTDANKPLIDYDLSVPDEIDKLLAWNDTNETWPDFARVEQLVSRQALKTPHATALTAQGRSLSYAELEARANQIAHCLHQRGAAPGTLVGLCLERGPWLLPALLGVLKTGAAYVPLDPGFPVARLQHMARDAGLQLIVTESALASLIDMPRERQLRIDADLALIEQASRSPLQLATTLTLNAPAYAIYTSGTTGLPKGVVVPQRAVANFLLSMGREPGLQTTDRLLAVTTLSFDIAVLELLLPLTVGACTVLASRDDAADGLALRQRAESEGITVMQATPSTWYLMLDAGWRAPIGFKALIGGEPLPPRLAQSLLDAGVELWNMYGPTETTVWSTIARITHTRDKITVGRPIANTTVWILDEQGRRAPIGSPGELCIGGMGVALGYHQRPELDADRFIPDPFSTEPGARLYRTGDLAKWREDGQIEHLGRLDHQVKIRGYRIELGEIESQLCSHPAVAQAVVTVHEDQSGDARLVAYLIAQGEAPSALVLREHLRQTLPAYMLPQQQVMLDAMPLLPNGKVNRAALPAPVIPGHGAAQHQAAAGILALRSDTERALGQVWAQLLGVQAIRPDDNFFDLGGHSLLSMQAITLMEKATGKRVTPRRYIFESLAQLAASYDATEVLETVGADAQPEPATPSLARRLLGRLRRP
jgi:amino acid adenylation domain-containing protein